MQLDANAAGNFWGDFPKNSQCIGWGFPKKLVTLVPIFQNSPVSSFLKFSSRQNIIGVFIFFFSQTFKPQSKQGIGHGIDVKYESS